MPTQRLPVVSETLCTRCGECVETCPVQALGVGLDGSVVVWPQAGMRHPLGLPSLAAEGIPDDATATLAIAATGSKVALLADAFDVDKDGFLTPRA